MKLIVSVSVLVLCSCLLIYFLGAASVVAHMIDPIIIIGSFVSYKYGKKYSDKIIYSLIFGSIAGMVNWKFAYVKQFTIASVIAILIIINFFYLLFYIFRTYK